MLSNEFIDHLTDHLETKILAHRSISGGDISSAYYIQTKRQNYFLKINNGSNASNMCLAEKIGLETIAQTNTIATPKIYLQDSYSDHSYLLMEYIETTTPTPDDFEQLGKQLAKLHQTKSKVFGFEHHNFIGSLHQYNNHHSNWCDFYINERLLPQINLAISKGLLNKSEVPDDTQMKTVLDQLLKHSTPSLLHGDLWSGNYLIATDGTPYLIDPAVYYGHSEIDIAMSKLFGGFGTHFYNAYHNIILQDEYSKARIEIYQLYYLLVHLNLFGSSYYGSVKHIFSKYF